MIPCEMMKDLLPAYAAGECSDVTRKAVDEHVVSCETCRKSLQAMTEPAVSGESTTDPARKEEIGKKMTFRKGIRKIRRRWLISILCILLIIPLSGLLFLGYNETRGEGYAFSNMKGLRNVNDYMKNLQQGDYEAPLKYCDYEQMYAKITNEPMDNLIYSQEYLLVEIGGEGYYVDLYSDRSLFEPYSEGGSDADFWAQAIIQNVENGQENLIPAEVFADAAIKAGNSLGAEITAIDFLSETSDSPYTYVLYYAPDGRGYYRPTQNGRLTEMNWLGLAYIPEVIFKTYVADSNQKIKAENEVIDSYRLLGLDQYTVMVKEDYIKDMKAFFDDGMTIDSYTVGTPYRRSEEWSPTDPYEYSDKEYWFVDVEVQMSTKDKEIFNLIITFKIDGDKLEADGSFMSVIVDGDSGETRVSLYSAYPNPYVLEEDSSSYNFVGGVTIIMADGAENTGGNIIFEG